jgi:hypothetical protein
MMNDEIVNTLKRFCVAMYILDLACLPINQARHAWSGKEEYVDEFTLSMEMPREWVRGVFKEFCMAYENPKRGWSAGGDPPDYHPDYFEILEVNVKGKKATAKVRQPALGRRVQSKGGGIVAMVPQVFTYYLKMTEDGWRLEDRRDCFFEDSGRTIKTGL